MTDTTFDAVVADEPDGVTVRARRRFAAPREVVWRAMTDASVVRRWLTGPSGWSMPVCEMDVRAGGAYHWLWCVDETGDEFGFRGEYLEVNAPDRLVSTEVHDPGTSGMDQMASSVITTGFAEDDGRTLMTTLIRYPDTAARDSALSTGMIDGMEMSYSRLDGLLPELRADANAS